MISDELVYEIDLMGKVRNVGKRNEVTKPDPELNPLLEGLEAARGAAHDVVHSDDEVTVDDQGDHWIFEFIPCGDGLGGGACVSIAKDDFRVLRMVRGQ